MLIRFTTRSTVFPESHKVLIPMTVLGCTGFVKYLRMNPYSANRAQKFQT